MPMVESFTGRSTSSMDSGTRRPFSQGRIFDDPLSGEGLHCEGHIHDLGGLAVAGGQIDQSALGNHVKVLPSGRV
jgi:hypothetical protein